MKIVKCLIQRYDPAVKKAPFKFINVGECEIDDPLHDDNGINGVIRHRRMHEACHNLGFNMKFYSSCDTPDYEYVLVVN